LGNISVTLSQILEVYTLVRKFKYDRLEAFKRVAKKYRIDQQTVRSACTRGIGINTSEFDEMLSQNSEKEFETILIRRFPEYQDNIGEFFADIAKTIDYETPDKLSKLIKQILPEEKKYLIAKFYIMKISERFKQWENRTDIPDDVKTDMKSLDNDIEENF
jgi:hypothetical protein